MELRVSDSGHGIENTSLSRIFDPFFTTRDVGEGTGLGLSICYGIVRDHGGQITVESRPHDGTTFTVLLPAILPDVGGARRRRAGGASRADRARVHHRGAARLGLPSAARRDHR